MNQDIMPDLSYVKKQNKNKTKNKKKHTLVNVIFGCHVRHFDCFNSVVALHTFYKIRSSELQRIQIPEISHQIQDIIMQEILNAMT